MKNIFFFFVLFLSIGHLSAQPIDDVFGSTISMVDIGIFDSRATPSSLLKKKTNLQNNTYLFQRFENGSVINNKNKRYSAHVNFDLLSGKLLIQDKNGIWAIYDGEIKYVETTNRKFIFLEYKKKNGFFEVLTSKKIALLKKWSIFQKMDTSNPLVAANELHRTYSKKSILYYYSPKFRKAKKLPTKFSKFLAIFEKQQQAMDKYIKQNNLSFKKEKDLVDIFTYYSTLQ